MDSCCVDDLLGGRDLERWVRSVARVAQQGGDDVRRRATPKTSNGPSVSRRDEHSDEVGWAKLGRSRGSGAFDDMAQRLRHGLFQAARLPFPRAPPSRGRLQLFSPQVQTFSHFTACRGSPPKLFKPRHVVFTLPGARLRSAATAPLPTLAAPPANLWLVMCGSRQATQRRAAIDDAPDIASHLDSRQGIVGQATVHAHLAPLGGHWTWPFFITTSGHIDVDQRAGD